MGCTQPAAVRDSHSSVPRSGAASAAAQLACCLRHCRREAALHLAPGAGGAALRCCVNTGAVAAVQHSAMAGERLGRCTVPPDAAECRQDRKGEERHTPCLEAGLPCSERRPSRSATRCRSVAGTRTDSERHGRRRRRRGRPVPCALVVPVQGRLPRRAGRAAAEQAAQARRQGGGGSCPGGRGASSRQVRAVAGNAHDVQSAPLLCPPDATHAART